MLQNCVTYCTLTIEYFTCKLSITYRMLLCYGNIKFSAFIKPCKRFSHKSFLFGWRIVFGILTRRDLFLKNLQSFLPCESLFCVNRDKTEYSLFRSNVMLFQIMATRWIRGAQEILISYVHCFHIVVLHQNQKENIPRKFVLPQSTRKECLQRLLRECL